jgi:hypothetical protein
MSEYYSASGYPATRAAGVSSSMRAELALISAGFDKMPALSGNGLKIVQVNSGGTALQALATTGTGSAVLAQSPTLVTPTLGAALATSINGVGFTGTNGKTLTVNNSLTLAGTDGSTLNIGTGGTLGSAAFTASSAYAAVNATFNLGTTALALNRSSGAVALTGITSIDGQAATVVTNANLTGPITSVGNATAVASQTGTGSKFVMDTSPTLVTPNIGVATATSINGVAITGSGPLAVGSGGTLGTAAFTAASLYALVAGQTFTGAVRATRLSEEINTFTPGSGAGVAVDWSKGGSTITNNGTNLLSFSNIPSGVAGHTLRVSNLNNTTFPAAVDWGVNGKPSIAGAATVVLVTMDSGTTIWAGIQHRAV